MRTLGIDLASQSAKTAGCTIEWSTTSARIVDISLGLSDDDIVDKSHTVDIVTIDAPFGWPQPFIDFVTESPDADNGPEWESGYRKQLCFRQTDLHVQELTGIWPLSVSSDKIAITAMRCAGLLTQLKVVDRSGGDRVVEVYPAAALRVWGFASTGYKTKKSGANEPLATLARNVITSCTWGTTSQHYALETTTRSTLSSRHWLDVLPPSDSTTLRLTNTWNWRRRKVGSSSHVLEPSRR